MSSFRRNGPFEPDDDSADSLDLETGRRWPRSAVWAVGILIVLNLAMGAYLVRDKFVTPDATKAPAASPAAPVASAALDVPKVERVPTAENQPELNSSAEQRSEPALKQTPQQADLAPHPSKRISKPAATTATTSMHQVRGGSTYRQKPRTQARYSVPSVPQSRTQAPVTDHAFIPIANVTPPPFVPPARPAVASALGRTEPTRKAPAPPVAASGIAVKGTQSNTNLKMASRVAPVGLPGNDKGWVPKMAVGPVNPKIEIVARPPEPKEDRPNCGGEVVIPCPTLKHRPSPSSPDDDR